MKKLIFVAANAALLLFAPAAQARVITGLEALKADNFAPLKGKRVGLVTNQTGIDSSGRTTAEIFAAAKNFTLAAVFSPEHGLNGKAEAGELVGDSAIGKIPVISLYGETRRPPFEKIKDLDIIVFDIQDIGTRFYTYLGTMAYVQEEADKYGIPFFVLDRPNPLGGRITEGPLLDDKYLALTAYFDEPTRHGMTAGEIALMHADAKKLRLKPEVIKMRGWKRKMLFSDTGLPWINPSPNIRNPLAAIMYAGTGCFEASNLSVGRGTDNPFLWLGAPWLNGKKLARRLNALKLAGVKFSAETKIPSEDVYAGKECGGITITVTNPRAVRPLTVFAAMACALRAQHPKEFAIQWPAMGRMTGNDVMEKLYVKGAGYKQIVKAFNKSAKPFLKTRKKYLLY